MKPQMTLELHRRRTLVSYAAPQAIAPMTRVILAKLGYTILEPDEFASRGDEDQRPDVYLADERSLGEILDDGGSPVPIVALTGSQGVCGADSRIAGAIQRPAGLHEFYRVLQQVLEEKPRTTPRVATHLLARCRRAGREWKVTLLSLSENGCLMRSPETLRLGTYVDLAFELPRHGTLELPAEIAYQLLPDVGAIFSSVAARARTAIAAYVTEALVSL